MLLTSRSSATLALASSSWLRAPKPRTSRPLATPSSALNKKPRSQSATRSKNGPPSPPSSSTRAPLSAATRFTRSHRTADHSSSTLRRQSSPQTSSSPSSSSFREKPLLRPYELSLRLIALCQKGDVDLAVTTLQQAPRNAQNIKVWNTIIQQCMGAKKYNLAYSVFTDMKRRGFMPNVRTYATILSGYASVDDWAPLTKQLECVHSIYRQLKQHLKNTHNPIDDPAGESDASSILYPIVLYIYILGKAGEYQKAFDVFHALDTDGPLAPDSKIYSTLLCILADRVDPIDVDPEVIEQSVSEAKYIWRRHMRSLDRQPQHEVEPRSVEAMVKVLLRGKPSDHELVFDILRDFCGLPRPGEPPSQEKKITPTVWILNGILNGCTPAGRPEMTVHYAQSVMNTRELHPILRAWHLLKFLRAHMILAKKGSASPSGAESVATWVEWMVAPDPTHKQDQNVLEEHLIVSALELCHRCKDVHSALRIVRAVISDNSQGPTSIRGAGSFSVPLEAWTYLFHLATKASPNEIWQCLELLSTHTSVLSVWESTLAGERLSLSEKKVHASLARRIVQALKTPLPSSDREGAKKSNVAEPEEWSHIRKLAELFLEKTHRRKS